MKKTINNTKIRFAQLVMYHLVLIGTIVTLSTTLFELTLYTLFVIPPMTVILSILWFGRERLQEELVIKDMVIEDYEKDPSNKQYYLDQDSCYQQYADQKTEANKYLQYVMNVKIASIIFSNLAAAGVFYFMATYVTPRVNFYGRVNVDLMISVLTVVFVVGIVIFNYQMVINSDDFITQE